MRNLLYCLVLIFMGCSSELDIIYEQPTIPVVYAVIDPYDTVHYVRVQKLFTIRTKEDWSLLNADSMQFKDVEVFLHGKREDSIVWTEQFIEINVNKEGGFFPIEGAQSFMLEHKLPIRYGDPFKDSLILEVRIHDLNLVTKAAAPIIRPANIINYKSRFTIYVYGKYPTVFAIGSTGEGRGGPAYSEEYKQIDFKVHFKEHFPGTVISREISWSTNQGWSDNAYFIRPTRLFNPIMDRLIESDSLVARTIDSIDVSLLKTCRFFNNYWSVRENWDYTDNPPYSNFDSSYGMFFTIARDEWTGMKLSDGDMDSLCRGYYYKHLKFKNW